MTWTLQTSIDLSDPNLTNLKAQIDAAQPEGNKECKKERDHQVDIARRAAFAIIAQGLESAGGVFANVETIRLSMTGHANPGHQASPEWSHEFFTINFVVNKYREEQ